VEELASHGLPLALFPGRPYGSGHLTIETEDLLCLYTDGVTEATNSQGEEFGLERLKKFLLTQIGQDLSDVDTALALVLEEHAAGEHFADDRTLLMLRRLPL
jgi:sigma-B regulation protein RsbU (phosphoserine phosphatase)